MSNGKPLIDDLTVLLAYEPRQSGAMERLMVATGLPHKQLYAHLNKSRFCRWIDYGVCLEHGWLTPEGEAELARLRKVAPGEREGSNA